MEVGTRFNALLGNITLTTAQQEDGETKHKGVRKCLNYAYYNSSSESANSMLVGSWGKFTRIRPPRDIDVLFVLPNAVYDRYQLRTGNKQSQLLQEVKAILLKEYPNTDVRGDGPVILIPFASFKVELVPAFNRFGTGYFIPITSNGGSYKSFNPDAEYTNVKTSDDASNGNTRHLIKMMKCWQSVCNVSEVKSFWLELLAVDFLRTWEHRGKSSVYYDYMVRDFFSYFKTRANSSVSVPGTYEILNLGSGWYSKAVSAHERALKAIEYRLSTLYRVLEGPEWQKIFGGFIPAG